MSADESAALVYDPTTPLQRTMTGALGTIASQAREGTPSLMVIGRVAGLREHLRWFDNRPLFGRRIIVTRSREQAGELVEMLEERGAVAITAPTIRIAPPHDDTELREACAAVSSFDWIVFTSANAVDRFIGQLLVSGDVRDLKGVGICTVGPSTATRFQQYGIRVDLTPAEYRGEAVLDALKAAGAVKGKKLLLPRADIAREVLADELREAGADVTEVVAYRTTLAEPERGPDHDIYGMLLEGKIDAVTFTSASTVRNFLQIYGEDQAADLLRGTVVAAIGPVTAEAAQQLGINITVMPQRYTIPDLVDALVDHFASVAETR